MEHANAVLALVAEDATSAKRTIGAIQMSNVTPASVIKLAQPVSNVIVRQVPVFVTKE